MRPHPVQQPYPPIWIGGNSTAAIRQRRGARRRWVPFPNPSGQSSSVRTPALSNLEELARRMQILRDHAAEVGRTDPIDVCFSPFADGAAATLEELHALEELGVTWAVLHVPHVTTRAAWIDAVKQLGDDVVAPSRA